MIHPVTIVTLDLDAKTKVRNKGREVERYSLDTIELRSYGFLYAHSVENEYVARHTSQILPSLNLQVTRFNWYNEHPFGNYDYYVDILGEVEQEDEVWTMRDLYLDVLVFEGTRAKIIDTDEYLQAIDAGHFLSSERNLALKRTHWLVNGLGEHGYRLDSFLAQHDIRLDWTEREC